MAAAAAAGAAGGKPSKLTRSKGAAEEVPEHTRCGQYALRHFVTVAPLWIAFSFCVMRLASFAFIFLLFYHLVLSLTVIITDDCLGRIQESLQASLR